MLDFQSDAKILEVFNEIFKFNSFESQYKWRIKIRIAYVSSDRRTFEVVSTEAT